MSTFLHQACAAARMRVTEAAQSVGLDVLRERAAKVDDPPGFATALAASDVTVIAEVKRASPSRGPIAEIPDPALLARAYTEGGAGAVSVLTEPRWFHGALEDLATIAQAIVVPTLRKDFIIGPYQVWEARAAGASAVLLIVAALDDATLADLLTTVDEAGLDALVEVHDAEEARRATAVFAVRDPARRPVIGVNARDLTTLEVDPERFAAVRAALPEQAIAVAESGVRGADDVRRLAALGADAVLVGEHVALADDPAQAVRLLVEAGRGAADTTGAPR